MTKLVAHMLKKYLHSICLPIHTDYVTFLFEKRFLNVKNTPYKRANDYQQNCFGCSLMLLTFKPWFKILLNILFTKMNARSRKRIIF